MPDASTRRLIAFVTAIGIFGLDRWSKWMVLTRLGVYDSKTVIPGFFSIIRSQNPGVAFGIFAESASRYRTAALIAMSIAAVTILAWLLWRVDRQDRATATGLSLIFGGALGNVYDRITVGTVTDFLDFHAGSFQWYIFNVADSAICVGAGLLIVSMLLTSRKEAAA